MSMRKKQWSDLLALAGFFTLIGLPAAIALHSVRVPGTLQIPSDDPSPLGYTWSLLLFLLPVLAFERWLKAHPAGKAHHRAFRLAVFGFFMIGVVLDLGLAYNFFTFPNRGAVLGIYLPAFDVTTCRWHAGYLPIEEFAFYYLGALFTVGAYASFDLGMARDEPGEEAARRELAAGPLVRVNAWPLVLGGLALAAAWIYKLCVVPGTGVPGYFTFIVCLGIVPTALLVEAVGRAVNVRAFGMTLALLTLISVMWEATLGVPYGWWNYQSDQMLGVFIGAWSQLPIESVLVWITAGWGAVMLYEALLATLARRGVPVAPRETA